jgi:hypothetical protein
MKKGFIASVLSLVAFTFSCTKLEEDVYDTITNENFYQTEAQVLAAAGPAYSNLRAFPNPENVWGLNELTTDEIVLPTRGVDWYNGGIFQRLQKHTWTSSEPSFNNAWRLIYANVNNCNRVIYQFSQLANKSEAVAAVEQELRGLRAFNYFFGLDLFGNIPYVTRFDVPKDFAPAKLERPQVYDSVEADLVRVIPQLSNQIDVTTYGRFHRYAAFATLAKLYLNAQVYTGTPQWDKAIAACDSVINSGKFLLSSGFFANFAVNNETSKENIFVIPYDNKLPQDWGSGGVTARMFQLQNWTLYFTGNQAFNMSEGGWNGLCAVPSFYNSYDPGDVRRKAWLVGPQFTPTGAPIYLQASTTPLSYKVNVTSIEGAGPDEGARLAKYDYTGATNFSLSNDYVVFRYADILLMKAEALMRKSGGVATAEAVSLVNQVRARAFPDDATKLYTPATLTLNALLDERGWEFAGEAWRRNDQIRFNTFNGGTWEFKPTPTDPQRNIYPIPQEQLNANPNLKQNPGY